MTRESELKAAEADLVKRQRDWEAGRSERDRLIAHRDATLSTLTGKLEDVSGQLKAKSEELDGLAEKSRVLLADIAENEKSAEVMAGKIQNAQATLVDLEAVIEAKRQRIDSDLQDYHAARMAGFRIAVAEDEAKATEARKRVEALQGDISNKRLELTDLQREAAEARIQAQTDADEVKRETTSLRGKLEPLRTDIQSLMSELTKLRRTREIVVAETTKAKAEHENFVEYEKRARKVLETKDRELMDKAQDLAQEDQHIKARRSYLADL